MKSQIEMLFIVFLLIISTIIITILYFNLFNVRMSVSNKLKLEEEIIKIKNLLVSERCLGTKIKYELDKNKIQYFIRYQGEQPECARTYKFLYRFFVGKVSFGDELYGNCRSERFYVLINGKVENATLVVCTGSYADFILTLRRICDIEKNGTYKYPFFFFEKVYSKGNEVCIKNICNKINCSLSNFEFLGKVTIIIKKQGKNLMII